MSELSETLDSIGLKFGTDKSSKVHDYLNKYEPFFASSRLNSLKILEVGVLNGASLHTWKQYFPNGQIIGADIRPEVIKYAEDRIFIEILDQSNIEELVRLGVKHGPFDIVIEDGSHLWEHQITSLRYLFPFVASGGLYVVEDLQVNYGKAAEKYRGISSVKSADFLKDLADLVLANRQIVPSTIEDSFLRTYGQTIESMTFIKHACVIRKGSSTTKPG